MIARPGACRGGGADRELGQIDTSRAALLL